MKVIFSTAVALFAQLTRDLELRNTLTQNSRARNYSKLNISKMIQDRHTFRVLQKLINTCDLLNCAIANDLD